MDTEKLFREIRIVAGVILIGVLAARIATLPDFSKTTTSLNTSVDKLGVVLDKASSLEDSAHKAGHKILLDYDDPDHPMDGLYYNLQNDFYNSQMTSKHLDDMVLATNENLNGKAGVFSKVGVLLDSVTTTVTSLGTDLNQLTTSTSETLVPLKASLENIDSLTKELSEEIAKGGDIAETVVKLNSNLDSFNTLLSDPNIAATIANGQATTASLASAMKTVDIVLLPYRKKVSQVRYVLDKLIGLVKVTIPF